MIHEMSSQLRPFNHDRMAYFTAFRTHGQDERLHQTTLPVRSGATFQASAAETLMAVPPSPTQLNDQQVETALAAVHQQAQEGTAAMAQVHSGLDAERVARLLGLLE